MSELDPEFDYNKYVSFKATDSFERYAENRITQLTGKQLDVKSGQIEPNDVFEQYARRALEELSKTPEGQEIIKNAAENNEDGKINFLVSPIQQDQWKAISSGDVAIGMATSHTAYETNTEGAYANVSMQRVMFHELTHIARGHANTDSQEKETIQETNAFMQKYYGEVPRNDNGNVSLRGSAPLEYNPNFKAEGHDNSAALDTTIAALDNIPLELLEDTAPELQSLHAIRHDRELFEEQYTELAASGQIELVNDQLLQLADTNAAANDTTRPTVDLEQDTGQPTVAAMKI